MARVPLQVFSGNQIETMPEVENPRAFWYTISRKLKIIGGAGRVLNEQMHS